MLAQHRGSGADGAYRQVLGHSLTQQSLQTLVLAKVGRSGLSAGQYQHLGIAEISVLKQVIGLNGNTLAALYQELIGYGYGVDLYARTYEHIQGSYCFYCFETFCKKDVNHAN